MEILLNVPPVGGIGARGIPPCRRADVHPCYACNLIDRDARKLCFDRLKRRHSHVTTTRTELEITKIPGALQLQGFQLEHRNTIDATAFTHSQASSILFFYSMGDGSPL